MDKIVKFITTFLFWMGLSGLQAQQAILSASNNATGSDGFVSYSVGQVAFVTITGGGGTITEGVQQPYEILLMGGIEPGEGIKLVFLVYPDPAKTSVNLKFENHDFLNASYQLKNLNGVLLKYMKISNDETNIPMDDLVPATYFLTVFREEKALQTYKIIKK